jgi:hypothetical protein
MKTLRLNSLPGRSCRSRIITIPWNLRLTQTLTTLTSRYADARACTESHRHRGHTDAVRSLIAPLFGGSGRSLLNLFEKGTSYKPRHIESIINRCPFSALATLSLTTLSVRRVVPVFHHAASGWSETPARRTRKPTAT